MSRIYKPKVRRNPQVIFLPKYQVGDLVRCEHMTGPCVVECSAVGTLFEHLYIRDAHGVLHKRHWALLEPITE